MVRHRQLVKAARFILASGKCFDSKKEKKEGGWRERAKSLHLKIHSIGKKQRERNIAALYKGSRDMTLNFRKKRND